MSLPKISRATALLSAAVFAACPMLARAEVIVDGSNVTFRLDARQWTDKPSSVNVAGSFQGWNKDATELTDADGDHIWEATVPVNDQGQHQYKFVVDSDRWISDATADPTLDVDDNYGGKNSGFIVGYDVRKAPPPKPDHVNMEAVTHDPATDSSVLSADQALLRIRVQPGDIQSIDAVYRYDQTEEVKRTPAFKLGVRNGLDEYGVLVPNTGATLRYTFDIQDGSTTTQLKPAGGEAFELALNTPLVQTPDWAKSAVWYQIFPERFRNGESSNDPGGKPGEHLVKWTSNWWQTQPGETPGDENFYKGTGNVWQRRYGGDIQGLRESLPYLRELGINAIYLNPVFEGESMHKYDTADFRHIDDNFGVKGDIAALEGESDDPATWKWTASDKLFLDFLDEAHRQGFKVIIDGVFNHVGRAHPFFQDVLAKGKNSKYADWFEITDWGDESNWRPMADPYEVHGKPGGIQWKAWDEQSGHLPVFKKDDKLGLAPGPRDHIMAITKRWLAPDGDPSRGIDGWRLDVPGDIPHPFWIDWRKVVKGAKPDAYITGEIWTWAQPWLNKGDQFDAVMNYQFAMPAQEFLMNEEKQMKPSVFASRLNQVQLAYPFNVALVQQNLYDSHDTDRVASMFVNPDRPYDGANRPQDNAANWLYSPAKPNDEQWQRLKQAAALQYTYVGAPMIYYGTEAGMWSPDDPSNRQPMIWQHLQPYDDAQVTFKQDLFDYYQRLAAVRQKLEALREGFYVPVVADDENNVLVYRRSKGDQHVYVVVNRSDQEQQIDVPLAASDHGKTLVNWLDEKQANVKMPEGNVTERATVSAIDNGGAVAAGETLKVTLPAYGTAVLSQNVPMP
ncbi:MAG TPA: alpha amylase N-terminal ig-like domain-containing protein [Tepidisphaeraceae bacterium]|jgi:glycosidase|nr:alpha amylase N-terminal ig-like domain-containing protein [Tepidisphaeraceae bacterium]